MTERLLTYLNYGNRFCGIEHTKQKGEGCIYATLLKQSKKELQEESYFESKSIQDISIKLPKNQHIVLVVNNDNVISKTIESEQQNALKLVYKSFPNINLEDFYFEVLSQKNKHFIALCRKDYVNNLIDEYTKQKLWVIDLALGNNLVGSISSFLDETKIYTSNTKIELENGQIYQIEKSNTQSENYNINGLEISNNQLLSFSGALQTVLKNNATETNFIATKNSLLNDFKQVRFFNTFLKIGGLFILGLLLVNFFFFNHYFNKVNELKQVSEINQSTKNQIIELNETVSKKQKMVDDILKSNGSKSSFYSNSIIHSLPKTILLSEFNYQPLLKRIKSDKPIELDENNITISGTSIDSEAFSNWLSYLEHEDWIDKVVTIDYGATASSRSDFEIKIVLIDD